MRVICYYLFDHYYMKRLKVQSYKYIELDQKYN